MPLNIARYKRCYQHINKLKLEIKTYEIFSNLAYYQIKKEIYYILVLPFIVRFTACLFFLILGLPHTQAELGLFAKPTKTNFIF